jgi:hypothetical protein
MKAPLLLIALVAAVAGCSSGRAASGGAIVGTSKTLAVKGSYSRVALDRVDRLSMEGGVPVIHGSTSAVTAALPEAADPSKPNPHWTLATESDDGRARVLTFTHDMSLDDFTIELPRSDAPLRFGGFSGRNGSDILLLAWGEHNESYQAELTITPSPDARGAATTP